MSVRFEQLRWHRDPAASGWRSRCWPNDVDGSVNARWQLLAYDDGRWEVRGPPHGDAVADGKEEGDGVVWSWSDADKDAAYDHKGHAGAKERAFIVFQSLTRPLSTSATT